MPFSEWEFTGAVESDNVKEIKAAVAEVKDVNAKGSGGATMLHAAAYWGSTQACELLMARGAQVNLADDKGKAALHYAVLFNECDMGNPGSPKVVSGKRDVCELLLKKGADVNARDAAGSTPLHRGVCPNGDAPVEAMEEICCVLIGEGANVNATNSVGATPLHLAAMGGLTNVCSLLLRKGADVSIRGPAGQTPIEAAEDLQQAKIAALLRRHEARKKREQNTGEK
jgi:26S proteasome non-ATPase regulatory subunit 10